MGLSHPVTNKLEMHNCWLVCFEFPVFVNVLTKLRLMSSRTMLDGLSGRAMR